MPLLSVESFADYRQGFDFPNSPINRWNKFPPEVIPLWVADMDFPCDPAITQAVSKRLAEGRCGYVSPPKDLAALVARYCQSQYQWTIPEDAVVFIHGIVPGLAGAVQAVSAPGDSVLVPSPLYNPFYEVVEPFGRVVQDIPFRAQNGRMIFDTEVWDSPICQSSRLLMWCNPHNPGGTVYTQNELAQVGRWLSADPARVVVSDEIHADMPIHRDFPHCPLASLSAEIANQSITLMSPNKAFNIPSIGMAYAIIPNVVLRHAFVRAMAPWNHFSPVSLESLRVCLQTPSTWLKDTLKTLCQNEAMVWQWAIRHADKVDMIRPQASYLVWMRMKTPCPHPAPDWIHHFARHGVGINGGLQYRGTADWIRLNIGVDPTVLNLALARMSQALA
jgi:cystathionine beta-lyase